MTPSKALGGPIRAENGAVAQYCSRVARREGAPWLYMTVCGCEKRHIIKCDAVGRRPWSVRFGLRLLAARRGYRREARYGDDGVVTRPCCASQSVTLIDPAHEPTGRAMGPLGSPVSVALPVKL